MQVALLGKQLLFSLTVISLMFFLNISAGYADDDRSDHSSSKISKVHGFDISHFNGDVSWPTVKDSRNHFVVLKATEGVDWVDPTFKSHWIESKRAGLIRGAYHFFVAHDDPVEEARWYIENVTLEPGDLPPIVDVERADKKEMATLADNLSLFVSTIEEHFGVKPIIYTGPNFWSSFIKKPFPEHHLWIADYGVDQPILPKGWKRWTFWQYSQEGALKGVEKPVDFNTFAGSLEELKALLMTEKQDSQPEKSPS